jgi:hypothetical protein
MRPTTRRTLESSLRHQPVTRDLRPRQLPTVTSHAVPTGECQSDPPSLLRTIRCSRPRGQPNSRASPLTFCSMSEPLVASLDERVGEAGGARVHAVVPEVDRGAVGGGRRLAVSVSVAAMPSSAEAGDR